MRRNGSENLLLLLLYKYLNIKKQYISTLFDCEKQTNRVSRYSVRGKKQESL